MATPGFRYSRANLLTLKILIFLIRLKDSNLGHIYIPIFNNSLESFNVYTKYELEEYTFYINLFSVTKRKNVFICLKMKVL